MQDSAYTSIQAAVSGVAAGSTIYVCDGIYNENISIDEPLTLGWSGSTGSDARTRTGPETEIDGSGGITYTSGATRESSMALL